MRLTSSAGLVTAVSESTPWDESSPLSGVGAVPGVPACATCRSCHLHDAPALCDALRRWHRCPELNKAIDGINYIAEQTRKEEESTRVSLTLRVKHSVYLVRVWSHSVGSMLYR